MRAVYRRADGRHDGNNARRCVPYIPYGMVCGKEGETKTTEEEQSSGLDHQQASAKYLREQECNSSNVAARLIRRHRIQMASQ